MEMTMAKTYSVAVPISGVIYVEVEAEDEKDAIEKALDSDQLTQDNLERWEAHRHIVQGNVCYAVQWEAEAELIDDGEDA
jgi:hypothetical protein